jgi:ubiquinol-cytochrome c reductase cytochrome b subunit
LSILHLVFIHDFTSGHPLRGFSAKKIDFWPYFGVKDIFRFIFIFLALLFLVFFFPQIIGDVENYKEANPLVTPAHIKPE